MEIIQYERVLTPGFAVARYGTYALYVLHSTFYVRTVQCSAVEKWPTQHHHHVLESQGLVGSQIPWWMVIVVVVVVVGGCGLAWERVGRKRHARIDWAAAEIFLFPKQWVGLVGCGVWVGGRGGGRGRGDAWKGMPAYVTSCLGGGEGTRLSIRQSEEGTNEGSGATSQLPHDHGAGSRVRGGPILSIHTNRTGLYRDMVKERSL